VKLLPQIVLALVPLGAAAPWAGGRSDDPPPAQEKPADPYLVKAAALYKITGYVKWAEPLFRSKDAPLTVAVFGSDPFGPLLDSALKGKKIGTHPLELARIPALENWREQCKGRSVLLLGDSLAAAEHGAGIALYIEKSKLRIAVNIDALRAAGVEVSSELLKLAKVIGHKEGGEGK
jgi:hypothetical protein